MANKAVLVTLPGALLEGIDSLVNTGYYSSRSDMIREVVRENVVARYAGRFPNIKELTAKQKDALLEEFAKDKDSSKVFRKFGLD